MNLQTRGTPATPVSSRLAIDMDDRIEAIEQTILQEKMAMERSQVKLKLLEKYTRPKTIKSLEIDVERKHAEELAKQAPWELERSKEAKLEKHPGQLTRNIASEIKTDEQEFIPTEMDNPGQSRPNHAMHGIMEIMRNMD